MKNLLHQKSRQHYPDRFKSKGSLPDRRSLSFIVYSLLVLLPALLVSSCEKPLRSQTAPDTPEQERKDSAVTRIAFKSVEERIGRLDVFIFGTSGVQPLEKHLILDSLPPSLELYLSEGDKLIAAVANSPKKFKESALARYSAVPQISYGFAEDSASLPIMGGCAESADREAEIELTPLLCEVVLGTISNTMDDYELLEEPRIRLRGINASARLFSTEDYLPSETIDKGVWAALPCDVGYYPQEPGTVLYCYPNETPESIIGQDRTALELECGIKGKRCSFTVDLPPLGRASRTVVEISVDGPDSFSCTVSQEGR